MKWMENAAFVGERRAPGLGGGRVSRSVGTKVGDIIYWRSDGEGNQRS